MKRHLKPLLILLLTMLFIVLLTNTVNADITIVTGNYDPGNLTKQDTEAIGNMTGTILAYIKYIGILVSVIVLTIIGIKYMLGSLDEKANYKESMRPYFIGCIVLVSATVIPSLVYDMLK